MYEEYPDDDISQSRYPTLSDIPLNRERLAHLATSYSDPEPEPEPEPVILHDPEPIKPHVIEDDLEQIVQPVTHEHHAEPEPEPVTIQSDDPSGRRFIEPKYGITMPGVGASSLIDSVNYTKTMPALSDQVRLKKQVDHDEPVTSAKKLSIDDEADNQAKEKIKNQRIAGLVDFYGSKTNQGTAYFRRGDSRQKVAFVDQEARISVHSVDEASVLAALQLSAKKWGSVHVSGTAKYIDACVKMAAEFNIPVTNPELQARIRDERERMGMRGIEPEIGSIRSADSVEVMRTEPKDRGQGKRERVEPTLD